MADSIERILDLFSRIALPVLVYSRTNKKIIYMNGPCEELTGHTLSIDLAIDIYACFASGQKDRVTSAVELVESQPEGVFVRENNLELKRRSGRSCTVSLVCSKIIVNNSVYFLLTLEDLTFIKTLMHDKQRLAEESIQLSKLAEIGQLSACLAHEINNPLAILSGHVDELIQKSADDNRISSALGPHLQPLSRSVERISNTVKILLSQAKTHNISLQKYDLRLLVERLLESFSVRFNESSVLLSNLVDKEIEIECDHYYFDQVLENIVTNALQALKGNGPGGKIELRSYQDSERVRIIVWNSGEAMTDLVKEKIFSPLFTTKADGTGNGLGLYIAKNMMLSVGGNIEFKSSAESGTEFYIDFKKSR
jgi:signal transduction histidine kinase